MNGVEMVHAGLVAREPWRVGVHVGHKQVRGRDDRRAPPWVSDAAFVGAMDPLALAFGDVAPGGRRWVSGRTKQPDAPIALA